MHCRPLGGREYDSRGRISRIHSKNNAEGGSGCVSENSGANGLAINTLRHGGNGSKHNTNILGDDPAPIWNGSGRLRDPRACFHTDFLSCLLCVNMRFRRPRTRRGLLIMISSVIHVPLDVPRPLALIHTAQTSVRLHGATPPEPFAYRSAAARSRSKPTRRAEALAKRVALRK